MQKQQEFSLRRLACGVHLSGSTRVAMNDATGILTGNIQTAVVATTIADDNFSMICHPVQREQPGEALIEAVCFVQDRNDDAELWAVRQELRRNCYPGQRYSRSNDLQC